MKPWSIRGAETEDLPQVLALLESAGLMTAGVPGHLGGFLVAAQEGRIIGTAGLELYDEVALLRSVAVAQQFRRRGLGSRLVAEALRLAGRREVRDVTLLTTSAAPFFRRLGFRELDRAALDPRLAASEELGDECCATAVAMTLRLPAGGTKE